jgi:hypothetical protein
LNHDPAMSLGQYFIISSSRGKEFLPGSAFSIGSQKQISCGYKIANHEKTSRFAYVFCSPAPEWLAARQFFSLVR